MGGLAAPGAASLSISHSSSSCQEDRDWGGPRKAASRTPLGVTEHSGPPSFALQARSPRAWCSLLRPPFDLSELPCPPHADVTAARPRPGLEPHLPSCTVSKSPQTHLRSRRLPLSAKARPRGSRSLCRTAPPPRCSRLVSVKG